MAPSDVGRCRFSYYILFRKSLRYSLCVKLPSTRVQRAPTHKHWSIFATPKVGGKKSEIIVESIHSLLRIRRRKKNKSENRKSNEHDEQTSGFRGVFTETRGQDGMAVRWEIGPTYRTMVAGIGSSFRGSQLIAFHLSIYHYYTAVCMSELYGKGCAGPVCSDGPVVNLTQSIPQCAEICSGIIFLFSMVLLSGLIIIISRVLASTASPGSPIIVTVVAAVYRVRGWSRAGFRGSPK